MQPFFLSLLIISCGGILPLFLWRRPLLMRGAGATLIAAGSLLGLVDAARQLYAPVAVTATIDLLNTVPITFTSDSLSAFFLVAIFAVSGLTAVYSFHYMDKSDHAVRTAAHFLFFSLLIAAMALVVTADNMVAFILCWEIMSLSSFFLVVYSYEKEQNRRAAFLYAVFSQVGAMFILAAFGVMYAYTESFAFGGASGMPAALKLLVFILAMVGFGSKAGLFPLHIWLPHAHPAAPSHISALMSGVMIKTGIYGILRLYAILEWHAPVLGQIVLAAGLVSGVMGVIYALGQKDLKKVLAFSSVENVGIILIGMGVGMIGVSAGKPIMAVLGFAGGLLHVLNHALFKSLLFMGAGMVLHRTGTGVIDHLGGLIKRMPITGTTFLIGALAIPGLPPFNGFVSEFLIYIGAFNGVALGKTNFVLSLLAIVGMALIGGLALAAFTRIFGIVFQGEPRSPSAQAIEKGPTMLLPMIVAAAACVVIGVFPTAFLTMAIQAVEPLQLGYGRIPLTPFIQITATITRAALVLFAVFLLLLALRKLLYSGKTVTRSGTWGCGFTQPTARMQYTGSSYAASILTFFKPLVPIEEDHPPVIGRFPVKTHYQSRTRDIAEHQMDRLIVKPVLFLFDKLRWLQHGDIHLYIGYILLAIVVALFFV